MSDDLQPTLAGDPETAGRPLPWPLRQQVYVALVGGALAVSAIGALNARRHGLPRQAAGTIAGVAVAIEVALIVLVVMYPGGGIGFYVGAGMAAYWCVYDFQATPDRVHAYFTDTPEPYAPLLEAGFLACIVARSFEIALVAVLSG